jgi:hypothetical protein
VSPHGGHPTLGEGERTLTGLVARLGIVPLELTRQALDVLHAGPFGSPLSPLDPREDTLTVLLLDHAGTPPEAVVDSNGAAALVDVLRAALGELPELPAVARSLAGKPVRVARPAPAGDPAIQAEV